MRVLKIFQEWTRKCFGRNIRIIVHSVDVVSADFSRTELAMRTCHVLWVSMRRLREDNMSGSDREPQWKFTSWVTRMFSLNLDSLSRKLLVELRYEKHQCASSWHGIHGSGKSASIDLSQKIVRASFQLKILSSTWRQSGYDIASFELLPFYQTKHKTQIQFCLSTICSCFWFRVDQRVTKQTPIFLVFCRFEHCWGVSSSSLVTPQMLLQYPKNFIRNFRLKSTVLFRIVPVDR